MALHDGSDGSHGSGGSHCDSRVHMAPARPFEMTMMQGSLRDSRRLTSILSDNDLHSDVDR